MPNRSTLPRYDLTDLRVAVAVIEERSVTRGAERCYLAPSSVSERIMRLEQALGVALLDRLSRGVKETPPGSIVADYGRRCFALLEQMHADLAPFSTSVRGSITIFANNTSLTATLPSALERLFEERPHISVSLREAMSAEVLMAVVQRRADIGICAGAFQHPDVTFTPYVEDELVILAPPQHRLAKAPSLRFADCVEENFASLHSGSTIHTFLMARAAETGQPLSIRVQVADYSMVQKLVASGAGIAVLPRSVLLKDEPARAITLDESWSRRGSQICVRRETTSANPDVAFFLRILAEQTAASIRER